MRKTPGGGSAMRMRHIHRARSRNIPGGVALNLLASALTILAAIALLVTEAALGDASAPVGAPARNERVVHDFYGAVNEAIRSGDVAAIDRVVAPNLVFHPPSARIAPGRAGLVRYLAGIHESFPAFRLRVEDVVIDGDRAVARVVGGNESPGGFLGLTLAAAPPAWGQFDGFRIADGRIVEMRSGAPAPVLFEPAPEVRLDPGATPHAVSFARLSAAAGERRTWGPSFGARVLFVVEGAIAVDLDRTGSPPLLHTQRDGRARPPEAMPGARLTLTAGDAVAFPPGTRYTLRHDASGAGVAAYAVALSRFPYIGPHQPHGPTATGEEQAEPPAVEAALNGELAVDPLAGVAVASGRAFLPPGATVAFRGADGYLFVGVEPGTLVVSHGQDAAPSHRLDSDGLALVEPGTPFALHNLGKDVAAVFVVTVLARDSPATPVP